MKRFFVILAILVGLTDIASAQKTENSGLSIPRFVSLRSNHINARKGPGTDYPIEWVYMQKGAPVEVLAEFDVWRKIKDWQGSESWIHQSCLSGFRGVKVIVPGENNIYHKDNYKSKVIAKVEDGVIGEILKCPAECNFCLIRFDSISGWMPRQSLYGIYPDEIID